MKISFKLSLLLLLVMSSLVSCSTNNNLPATEEKVIPTPQAGLAVIYGQLTNIETDEPPLGIPYLANLITGEDSALPPTISFSYQNSLGAIFDAETGDFYFADVSPDNRYAIVLVYGPGNIQVVKDKNNIDPLIISVSPNESYDLGKLEIEEN